MSCLYQRKTVREFNEVNLHLSKLSNLLYYSFAFIHNEDAEMYRWRKASPSGGNLHAAEIYISVNNVVGLSDCLYYYNDREHTLEVVNKNFPKDKLAYMLLGQHYSKNANVHIFISYQFQKMAFKYPHSRAYRVALLDVGHLSQTFQLVATSLGLDTWITGAFRDDLINQCLNLDGQKEAALFYLSAGYSNGQVVSKEMLSRGYK